MGFFQKWNLPKIMKWMHFYRFRIQESRFKDGYIVMEGWWYFPYIFFISTPCATESRIIASTTKKLPPKLSRYNIWWGGNVNLELLGNYYFYFILCFFFQTEPRLTVFLWRWKKPTRLYFYKSPAYLPITRGDKKGNTIWRRKQWVCFIR